MCRNVGFNEEFAWLQRISDIDKHADAIMRNIHICEAQCIDKLLA